MFLLSRAKVLFVLLPALLGLSGCSSLGVLNAVLPKDAGSSQVASDVAYGSDPRQKLDVYAPTNEAATGKRDVVVFVYGGSWDNGSRSNYSFAGRAFASKGFVTVIGDYRLVPDHPYPDFVQDTASVVAWAHRNAARFGGDPNRIFLVGHSAGAYNAAMVAFAPNFLQADGVSPDVVKGFAGLAGPYDFLPLDVDASIAAFGHLSPDDLRLSQPINRIASDTYAPPAFLATGADDTTVRPRNTEQLAEVLRAHGHSVQTKIYPDLGHAGLVLALSRPLRNKAPALDDVVAFFRSL
ncbi:alpha/beta hydrolase [Tianweitania sp. BSSL-BM11]|uniref:Alpha/beta hydrolase n=1 Tax=Tianweitania aestuarii TaxID=2814886 RepID=A0ABS5S042_9HYPH|nr:alpha/beta hydrolase [Tianweitania aestuarii]MBS9721906.1 alpha/beta hydrolase [Tianweitania aestuarii]